LDKISRNSFSIPIVNFENVHEYWKYLVVIMRSDLSRFYCIIYTLQKACSAIHFVMRIVKMGNKYTKALPTRH